jgi:hypothetical protein
MVNGETMLRAAAGWLQLAIGFHEIARSHHEGRCRYNRGLTLGP